VVQGWLLFLVAGRGMNFPDLGITDLGRDLVGAHAVETGGSPYGQLGDLNTRFGAIDVAQAGKTRETGWVVHPPLAIASARFLLNVFGVRHAEIMARRISYGSHGGMVRCGMDAYFHRLSMDPEQRHCRLDPTRGADA
jgi:hypothetical protein